MQAFRWIGLKSLLLAAALTQGVAHGAAGAPGADAPVIPEGSVFVHLRIHKRELYVGESVPIDIQVGAQDGVVVSLDNPPRLRGNAFTLDVLPGEPDRESAVIDGKPFTVLAWHSVLAPIKPGSLPLVIEAPLTVRVPTAHEPEANFVDESTGGDAFTDPAFQSMLETTTEQPMLAANEPMTFQVLALPAEGRPAGFSGAVGSFDISSELSGSTPAVGEPLLLRMHVKGSGNFDRVASPMLGEVKQWKAYRPRASFHASDAAGYRGEKVFEQAVVPQASGTQRLPPLAFSYFDPETRHYAVARAELPDIDVRAGTTHEPRDDGLLRADHEDRHPSAPSLLPPYLQPRWLVMPLLMLVGFSAKWAQLRRRVARRSFPFIGGP